MMIFTLQEEIILMAGTYEAIQSKIEKHEEANNLFKKEKWH